MITRYIYPFWLREKISHRLQRWLGLPFPESPAALVFCPQITMQVQPEDIGHQSILLNGFYELALSQHISRLAQRGGLLVDVGANYGYYSLLWLGLNPRNHCLAFEAAPDNQPPLQANIERNDLVDRFQLEKLALSSRTGTVLFSKENATGQTGWGGIALQGRNDTIEVEATSLDQYWGENHPEKPIDVLKIDVEGADTLVLEGAVELLKRNMIRHVFFEKNTIRMEKLYIAEGRAEALLHECGYRIEQIAPNEYHAWI